MLNKPYLGKSAGYIDSDYDNDPIFTWQFDTHFFSPASASRAIQHSTVNISGSVDKRYFQTNSVSLSSRVKRGISKQTLA